MLMGFWLDRQEGCLFRRVLRFWLAVVNVARFALAAVARGAHRRRSRAGAQDEPERVTVQTLPECAAFCGGDGGVAFAGDGF